ncbi:MAG: hypothetical protein ACJAS6_000549 [Rickettsiales bacterium]|jgi:hypothetical protein
MGFGIITTPPITSLCLSTENSPQLARVASIFFCPKADLAKIIPIFCAETSCFKVYRNLKFDIRILIFFL